MLLKRPSGAPYIAAIVVLVLLIIGLIWFKFSRNTEPARLPPVIQSVNAIATPLPQVIDIPPPPELDSGPERSPEAGVKRPSVSPNSCAGPCSGDAPPALRSALQAAGASARGCYERALRTDAQLQGRVVVAVRIGSTGNVCSASVGQDTLRAANVSSCVVGLFRGRRFPAPVGGGCVDVQVPLSFKPKDDKK
jgi:hypothetical protein